MAVNKSMKGEAGYKAEFESFSHVFAGNGDSTDDLLQWQDEMRKSLQQETRFMQELRARRDIPGGKEGYSTGEGKTGYSNGRTQREP